MGKADSKLASLKAKSAAKQAPAKAGLAGLEANRPKGFVGDREFIPPEEHAKGKNSMGYVKYLRGLAQDAKDAKKSAKSTKTVNNPFQ